MIIRAHVKTGMDGSMVIDELSIPDEEFEGLSEEDKTKYLEDFVRDWVYENIEWGFDVFGDNEEI